MVNGYFIVQSPSSFFSSVFSTLSGSFLPNGISSVGFELANAFPILLSTYSQLFEITALLAVFLLLYWNRKELIPLFSMIPFLFADKSISSYYATFLFLLIFAFCTWSEKGTGRIERIMRKHKRMVYATVVAVFLLIISLIYYSHATYVRNFNVTLSNQELILDRANATTIYEATINYHDLGNGTLYAYAITLGSDKKVQTQGFMNESIIPGAKPECGSYDCGVNVNRIALPKNGSVYDFTADVKWADGASPVRYFAIEMYNGQYFYAGDPIYNSSS